MEESKKQQQQYSYHACIKERNIDSNSLEELAKELQVSTTTIRRLINKQEKSVLASLVEVSRTKTPSTKKQYVKKQKTLFTTT